MPRRSSFPVRTVAIGIVVALIAAAGFAAVATVIGGDKKPSGLTRAELETYQSAIAPVMQEGGRTVELGMKPAIKDLAEPGGVPAAAIAGESDAWIRDLTSVRTRVAAVTPPKALAEAHRLFDAALGEYLAAAALFGRAARAPAAERRALIDHGLDTAERADDTYDAASRIIQRWRRDLGLGATADFPDPDTVTS